MGVFSNLNYIKDIYQHPCKTPNIDIIIETALPAAGLALFQLAGIGCSDIMKMKFGKAPWHTRGINGLLKGAAAPRALGLKKYLFTAPYVAIEAGLWYWLVADAATGFVANWMSLMYQQQGCTSPGRGHTHSGLGAICTDAGHGGSFLIGPPAGSPCHIVGGDKIQVFPGCQATISYNTQFVPFLGTEANNGSVRTWIQADGGSPQNVVDGTPGKNGGTQFSGGAIKSPINPGIAGISYSIHWEVQKGLMCLAQGSADVSAYGHRMNALNAGCSPKPVQSPWP